MTKRFTLNSETNFNNLNDYITGSQSYQIAMTKLDLVSSLTIHTEERRSFGDVCCFEFIQKYDKEQNNNSGENHPV